MTNAPRNSVQNGLLLSACIGLIVGSSVAAAPGRKGSDPLIEAWSRPELVTTGYNGKGTNSFSDYPTVSRNGRYVAYSSYASNIVRKDQNEDPDVFLLDRRKGKTVLVSRTPGGKPGKAGSGGQDISGSGRFVIFSSGAEDLTKDTGPFGGTYVFDRKKGTVKLLTRAYDGGDINGLCGRVSISQDARFVAFESQAENLIDNQPPRLLMNIYRLDRAKGKYTKICTKCEFPSISDDGRWITYTGLRPSDDTSAQIYLYDAQTDKTTLVSRSFKGKKPNSQSTNSRISGDGRWIVFNSLASDIVRKDRNETNDVFLYNRSSKKIAVISKNKRGQPANGMSRMVDISDDGAFVAFSTVATGLAKGDKNSVYDIYFWDRVKDRYELLSVSRTGKHANSGSIFPRISGGGRFVVFTSSATNMVPKDRNGYPDNFIVTAR